MLLPNNQRNVFMKYLLFCFLTVFSTYISARTIATTCHGCTDWQYKQEAESFLPTRSRNFVYVFDSDNEKVSLFKVYTHIIDDYIEEAIAIPQTPSSEVILAYQNYLTARRDFYDEIDERYTSYQIKTQRQRVSDNDADPVDCTAHDQTRKYNVGLSTINAFSFIHYTEKRREMFTELMGQSEVATRVTSTLNNVKNTINSSTQLKLNDINMILKFQDGTSIKVYVEPMLGGLTYKEDSGIDANCNTIPESKAAFKKGFKFTNEVNLNAMKEHMWYQNAKWMEDFKRSSFNVGGCYVKTRCRWEGEILHCYGHLICD